MGEPTEYIFMVGGNRTIYIDTAGILDNRTIEDKNGKVDEEALAKSRIDKINSIGTYIKNRNLAVSRVMYCVAATEAILAEEIVWLADLMHAFGAKAMDVFAVVLTKVDDGFKKKKNGKRLGQ